MNLHSIENTKGSTHKRKRLGRGMSSGHGKTSGKGHKGQMARKGHKRKPGFEGGQVPLIRRIPKRGFTSPFPKIFVPVNVGELAKFKDGSVITADVLRKAGLATGPCHGIKILGRGDLDKKLTVKVCAFSKSAQAKIEAAGGSCEVVKG